MKLKNYGSFDYGRNLGALYDVEAWTDMFPNSAAIPLPRPITL